MAGCGEASDGANTRPGSTLVDSLVERGIGKLAEGRWECVNEISDRYPEGNSEDPSETVSSVVNISADGLFSYEELPPASGFNSGTGTWEVEGLQLKLAIPWQGDGANGFYRWVHEADADPPTHLEGEDLSRDSTGPPDQELDVDIGKDRIRIVQKDVPGGDGPNYDWDVSCTRESSDPGEIPPTVPPSDGDDDEEVVPEGSAPAATAPTAATTPPGGS